MRYIDLFAGIGGFHVAMHKAGGECVFASEIDSHARETYTHNMRRLTPGIFDKGRFAGDIKTVKLVDIPEHDVLCAGFPCQPFSQAGFKKGFAETRGTLFFDIANIIKAKKPKAVLLENVRHLLKHDNGNTYATIASTMEQLGYSFHYQIIKASEHGLPQYRPRLIMVGLRGKGRQFKFPPTKPLKKTMSDIMQGQCTKEVGFTLRVGGRGSKITDRRNWDTYMVDGKITRLKSEQGLAMQGFPKWFKFPANVSETQAMKQLGNSVAVPVIHAVAKSIGATI